ncbi:MAG: hypothetical protein V4719_27265 [Planctomycetota bacterium]
MSETGSESDQPQFGRDSKEIAIGEFTFFARGRDEFLQLPIEFRWEFTRRHPYYLRFWSLAASSNPRNVQPEIQEAAQQMLWLINVVGDTCRPELSYSELDSDPPVAAYAGGALTPVTYRTCIGLLGFTLSPQSLEAVAQLLLETANEVTSGDQDARQNFVFRQSQLRISELDQIPNPGVISFRPRAPTRAIIEDLRKHVEDLKQSLQIVETRRREDKLPQYLQVWDLREGWTGNGYDPRRELTYRQISQLIGLAETTVAEHHRSAFRIIFGHDYAPRVWWGTLAPLKWEAIASVSRPTRARHPLTIRTPRDAPAPQLRRKDSSLLENTGIADPYVESNAIAGDIESQIQEGRNDEEIAATLECEAGDSIQLVAWFRQHLSTIGPFRLATS